MVSPSDTARLVGILFIVAMMSSIFSGFYLDDVLTNEALPHTSENQMELKIGSTFLVILAFSVVSIPVLLYPLISAQNKSLALGYVVARIFEGAFDLVMATIPLLISSLNSLNQEFSSNTSIVGSTLLALNDWSRILENIPYCCGALILYVFLYRTKVVPRWLSAWGLLGAIAFLGTVPFRMFYTVPEWMLVFALPLVVNEMVLAVWLITKGFRS